MENVNWYVIVGATALVGALIRMALSLFWKGGAWTKSVDNRLDHVTNRLDHITNRVDRLYDMFTQYFGQSVAKLQSPISLSEYGEKLSQRVNAPLLADRYAEQIRGNVVGLNAYQIQELAFTYAQREILNNLQAHDTDRFDQVTTCAYEEGIEPEKIMRVIGILMRDILLKYAGHSHQAVDDHTPPTSDR